MAEASLPPLRNGDKIRQLRMKVAELDRLEKAKNASVWVGL